MILEYTYINIENASIFQSLGRCLRYMEDL